MSKNHHIPFAQQMISIQFDAIAEDDATLRAVSETLWECTTAVLQSLHSETTRLMELVNLGDLGLWPTQLENLAASAQVLGALSRAAHEEIERRKEGGG